MEIHDPTHFAVKARKASRHQLSSDQPSSSKLKQAPQAASASASTFATSKALEFRSRSQFCFSTPSIKEFLFFRIIGSRHGRLTPEQPRKIFGNISTLAVTASWDFCKVRCTLSILTTNNHQLFIFRHCNSYQRYRLRDWRFEVCKAVAQQPLA